MRNHFGPFLSSPGPRIDFNSSFHFDYALTVAFFERMATLHM